MFIFTDEALPSVAWDCDPDAMIFVEDYDADLDETNDTTDWQVLVLDRFGDRMVTENLISRGDASQARCW